jgi:hypothetical protein
LVRRQLLMEYGFDVRGKWALYLEQLLGAMHRGDRSMEELLVCMRQSNNPNAHRPPKGYRLEFEVICGG